MSKLQVKPDTSNMFELDSILGGLDEIANSHVKSVAGGATTSDNPNLDNYSEIAKSDWIRVPADTYIRYFDLTGKWRPGGKVKSIEKDKDGNMGFKVGSFNAKSKRFFMWSIKFANIKHLYKYVTSATNTVPARMVDITGGQVNQQPQQSQQSQPQQSQYESSNDLTTMYKYESKEDQLLDKLGSKLLFDDTDGDILKKKVDGIESDIIRMSDDMKKMFTLIKRIYLRLEKANI
jgi:hypothetical protein